MANWYGSARSNYVRFKPEALLLLKGLFDITTHTDRDGLTTILSQDEAGTPSHCYVDDDAETLLWELGVENADNVDDISLLDVVHLALEPDSNPFIWIEVGAEKLRYLTGIAIKIWPDGRSKTLNLNEIYDPTDTRAEY